MLLEINRLSRDKEYKTYLATKTRDAGQYIMLLAIIAIFIFVFTDYYNLKFSPHITIPFRVIGLVSSAPFLLNRLFSKDELKNINLFYGIALVGMAVMMVGLTTTVIYRNPHNISQSFAVTLGNASYFVSIIIIALGARKILINVLIPLIAAFLILLIVNYNEYPQSTGFGVTLILLMIVAVIFLYFQEKSEYEKFTYLREIKDKEQILEAQKKELERVNEELKSFNYSISHDLKTPLRSANSFAELLKRDVKNQKYDNLEDYLQFITEGMSKIHQLLDDLLSFSNIGNKELYSQRIDSDKLVQEVLRNYKGSQYQNIQWKIGSLPDILGDKTQLEQVWLNLIGNAVKYSSKKEKPFIELGFKEEEEDCIFFIKDNGSGFNMAFQEKLFVVFQRLHSDNEFEGTGVGLAIVKKVINRHNGEIWAHSQEGQGASFYFSLPKDKIFLYD